MPTATSPAPYQGTAPEPVTSPASAPVTSDQTAIRLFLCDCHAHRIDDYRQHLDNCPYAFFIRWKRKRALFGGIAAADYLRENRKRFFVR